MSYYYSELEATTPNPTPTPTPQVVVWERVIIMVVCSLSMIGTSLIILSFVCSKDLRSRGRHILVHISLMDLGVAVFNFSGACVNFDKYYSKTPLNNCTVFESDIISPSRHGHYLVPQDNIVMCPKSLSVQYLCVFQAGLALYFTYGSILWTNALSFYLFFRIVHSNTNIAHRCLYASYVICYLMPLVITLWLGLTGRLGYSPYESSGWCSIILMHPLTKERDIYASVFGYNLWIVVTFVFVPVLSCAVHINVKQQAKNTALYRRSDKFMLALFSVDYKFILIPLFFILLRMWSFIGDILHLYIGKNNLSRELSVTLIVLEGIGDSGQGITNTLIFLVFTKKFKDSVMSLCSKFRRTITAYNVQRECDFSHRSLDEDKSLLDSNTSIDNRISPHQFTSPTENITPIPLNI